MSGACESEPEPAGNLTLPLHLIERGLEAALERMGEVEVNLAYYADELPTVPLEQAALEERVGVATEELRLVRDYVAKLVGRVEQARRDGSRAAGRGVVSRRAVLKPWPGILAPWPEDKARGSGDTLAGPV